MKTPPIPARDIVVIGTSTGGVEALRLLVAGLPSGFTPAVLVVMHIGTHESILPSLLARTSVLPVRQARHGDLVEAGRILVAPPDFHLTMVRSGAQCKVVLARTARENHTRPAIDPLFRAAAAAFGARATGVILTGALDDGTAGLAAIKACGGTAVVQDPAEAMVPDMPASAIDHVDVDHVLKLEEIPQALLRLAEANAQGGAAPGTAPDIPQWVELENRFGMEGVEMHRLEELAQPSTFTCPDCHGTLWELKDQQPRRFRCHTGHAYTERNLVALQGDLVEDSIWSAMRALQEKEMLLRRMSDDALRNKQIAASLDYSAQARQAQRCAEVLRGLIVSKADESA
ncbi:chemotaxis protein CheB [Massilia sp. HP4]|uniref:chemotaxis protein CheB n=1 Tax=Massilia sp. HP4 TaxID=2562316 RepID=UPI0010C04230|nr:chemotaxis protein CheB [Massilia sp. HP4]